MKTKIICLILAAFTVLSLASCGVSKADKEEITNAAKELIEASYEINEIYFGHGLEVTDTEVLANTEYWYVAEDCPYKSMDDIKKATAKVYSSDYCEDYLYLIGFEGIANENEEESNIAYARFKEDTKGKLCQMKSASEGGFDLKRTYDFSTITVESYVRGKATIKIKSLVDGKEDTEVTLTLVKQADGWRLDSPTY